MITLKVCSNDEILPEVTREKLDEIEELRTENIEIVTEQSFAYWNGGKGFGSNHVAVKIDNYGTLLCPSNRAAENAVAWIIKQNLSGFPSSEQITEALELREKIIEMLDK